MGTLRAGAVAAVVVAVAVAAGTASADVVQRGNVVVIEGDASLVTDMGDGDLGMTWDQIDLAHKLFYERYAAEFDMIVMSCTFVDRLGGTGRFYLPPDWTRPIQIGLIKTEEASRVNGYLDALIGTLGHEFAHRWGAYDRFRDPVSGEVSEELIGSDGSHWSFLFDTGGSLLYGFDWIDNGDGTFTIAPPAFKMGDLELWHMGYLDTSEVPDSFIIRDATSLDGSEQYTSTYLGTVQNFTGHTIRGTRADLGIDDIIAAEGVRSPPIGTNIHHFRVAHILVTAPGQLADDPAVQADVADWNQADAMFVDKFAEWTKGRGTMCMDPVAPCPLALAEFSAARVSEGMPSDGDGVVEPGEHARVEVDWVNHGNTVAHGAVAALAARGAGGAEVPPPADMTIPDLPAWGMATTTFDWAIPDDSACGGEIAVTATASLDAQRGLGWFSFQPGTVLGAVEDFSAADGAGWRVDVDGTDTAVVGRWEHGDSELSMWNRYNVLQPEGGRSGADDLAWWTGLLGNDLAGGDDVGGGTTSLVSKPYDLTGVQEPALRYHVWYLAWDMTELTHNKLTTGDDLVVEVSADGGATWQEIDRVSGPPRAWEQRDAPLAGKIPSGATSVMFRFTAQDSPPDNVVEVGIDDVSVVGGSTSCAQAGGCGCRTGGPGDAGGALLLLLFVVRARPRPRPRRTR